MTKKPKEPSASVGDAEREFDLQPHPRILPMLGEINLDPWQCLAELVDNSIDAFMAARSAGETIEQAQVVLSLPTKAGPGSRVAVRDNGPGMDAETLENAVKAGWTGNDPIGRLGMFGMGFNIATARMGRSTTVWSAREEDAEWHGLEIDFDRLIRQRHFRTPVLTRPKVDPHERGTEITIERLKPEQMSWLTKPANRSKVKQRLEQVYASMLRPGGVPITVAIQINTKRLEGYRHCVWGDEESPGRSVVHGRYGQIEAFQRVDRPLSDRRFCTKCWVWLASGEEVCPSCDSADDVVERERRVYGWLGVQRYLDSNEYGIDFLRHGRKIEVQNYDLFHWQDGTTREREYPIDDPRNRGRLVGEIHLDHCRVTYTKDRFDRNDPAWQEMLHIVRGEGPLRPDKAAELGYGNNQSPLFLLFQAFRRSTPKPKVAGCYTRHLAVPDNDRAREMAQRFHAGEPEYQGDERWWELLEEADRALLREDEAGGTREAEEILGGTEEEEPSEGGVEEEEGERTPLPRREVLPSLSREFRDEVTEQRWRIEAYDVELTDPDLVPTSSPWRLRQITSGAFEFLVSTRHPVFASSTMTPLDGLLAELAWSAMDFMHGRDTSGTFASVLAGLRDRYAGVAKLDPAALSAEASSSLRAMAGSLSETLGPDDAKALFQELSPTEQEVVLGRLAQKAGAEASRIIEAGRFLEYAPRRTILRFFEEHPELFFDGRYWDVAYEGLDLGRQLVTDAARHEIMRRYTSFLADAIWLADNDPEDLSEAGRSRLLRASLSLDLLSSDVTTGG